jgi:hypothetical protein
MSQNIFAVRIPRGTWCRFTFASTRNALKLVAVSIGGLLFLTASLSLLAMILFLM